VVLTANFHVKFFHCSDGAPRNREALEHSFRFRICDCLR